ncbi:ribonuclease toxin HepT-like protein [Candidatus Bipolaricaulota sp. J31]
MKRDELAVLWAEIEGSLSDLDRVVREIEQVLSDIAATEPSYRDKAAIGAFLHSFYNGIENILKRIAEEVDHAVPLGSGWHRALLQRMASEVEGLRPAVLSSEMVEKLLPYLGFRHFFRHSYTFEIDWEKLKPLATSAREVLKGFKGELTRFFDKYSDVI